MFGFLQLFQEHVTVGLFQTEIQTRSTYCAWLLSLQSLLVSWYKSSYFKKIFSFREKEHEQAPERGPNTAGYSSLCQSWIMGRHVPSVLRKAPNTNPDTSHVGLSHSIVFYHCFNIQSTTSLHFWMLATNSISLGQYGSHCTPNTRRWPCVSPVPPLD